MAESICVWKEGLRGKAAEQGRIHYLDATGVYVTGGLFNVHRDHTGAHTIIKPGGIGTDVVDFLCGYKHGL